MARYIDAEKCREYFDKEYKELRQQIYQGKAVHSIEAGFVGAERAIHKMPTADVAPKSEVDRLEKEVRLLTENSISAKYPCHVSTSKGLILTKSLEEYDKLLADISSELAREIFEEIDSIFRKYYEICSQTDLKLLEPILQGERFIINEMWHEVAELKKKYTDTSPADPKEAFTKQLVDNWKWGEDSETEVKNND